MKREAGLEGYFAEARSWDADRVAMSRRLARLSLTIAGAGWLAVLLLSGALIALMPLKRVEPFLIRVDHTTGVVDSVPIYTGKSPMPETVTRYFLTHYVTVCERFNYATAESDYEECGSFHSAQRNQAWYALWNPNNPASPLNTYKDGTTVRAQVTSVSFFKRANGVGDLAQVRYVKAKRLSSGANDEMTHWIATLEYAYTDASPDPKVRAWNPLGFKIVDFRPEPEVLNESPSTPTALAATGMKP